MCALVIVWEMKSIDEECELSGYFHEPESKLTHLNVKTQVKESQSNRIGNVYCYKKASSDHSGLLKVAHKAAFYPKQITYRNPALPFSTRRKVEREDLP